MARETKPKFLREYYDVWHQTVEIMKTREKRHEYCNEGILFMEVRR